jgi:hypothetical protein
MNIFEQAARQKIRFESVLGLLCVEDLWDLPLTSLNSKRANLDDVARLLDAELKSTSSVSFVNDVSEVNAKTKLMFDVVIHVINTKITEAKAAKSAADVREKKQKIMAIIERKQEESLSAASIDDLQQMLASL